MIAIDYYGNMMGGYWARGNNHTWAVTDGGFPPPVAMIYVYCAGAILYNGIVYNYIHIHIHIHMHVCMHVCMYAWMYVYVCL